MFFKYNYHIIFLIWFECSSYRPAILRSFECLWCYIVEMCMRMWVTWRRQAGDILYVETLGGQSYILDIRNYSLSKPITGFLLSYKCYCKGQAGSLCCLHRKKKTWNCFHHDYYEVMRCFFVLFIKTNPCTLR